MAALFVSTQTNTCGGDCPRNIALGTTACAFLSFYFHFLGWKTFLHSSDSDKNPVSMLTIGYASIHTSQASNVREELSAARK